MYQAFLGWNRAALSHCMVYFYPQSQTPVAEISVYPRKFLLPKLYRDRRENALICERGETHGLVSSSIPSS